MLEQTDIFSSFKNVQKRENSSQLLAYTAYNDAHQGCTNPLFLVTTFDSLGSFSATASVRRMSTMMGKVLGDSGWLTDNHFRHTKKIGKKQFGPMCEGLHPSIS